MRNAGFDLRAVVSRVMAARLEALVIRDVSSLMFRVNSCDLVEGVYLRMVLKTFKDMGYRERKRDCERFQVCMCMYVCMYSCMLCIHISIHTHTHCKGSRGEDIQHAIISEACLVEFPVP